MSPETETRLQRGDFAPEFESIGLNGEPFSLGFAKSDAIWLAFYRYASCPMCNMHFDDVLSRQKLLADQGIQFVAVFESAPKNFPKRISSQTFQRISILPDPHHSLYLKYGVERSLLGAYRPQAIASRIQAVAKGYRVGLGDGHFDRIPAHFLILPGGYIHQAYYGKSIADHVKWRDLDDFMQSLEGLRRQRVEVINDDGDDTQIS